MKTHRYILEKYKNRNSRFNCPHCGSKKTFTRYIDIETGQYINEKVGRCNREQKCGYHYTPKQYFSENETEEINYFINVIDKPEPPISYLNNSLINADYKNNNLYRFLVNRFNTDKVNRVMQLYKIGSSYKWHNSTIFYQFDKFNKCRTGKIMKYDINTGKRIKKPYNHISWIHTDINNFNLKQCLFGEHLIKISDNTPIGIVESEKTALIMTIVQPEIIWLATGGISNLSKNKVTGLGYRKVVLFPDSGCADKWRSKVKEVNNIFVSNNVEKYPVGYDLADIALSPFLTGL